MNDDFPFTSMGDEPVEARIVAWVLGEASPFEAAELQRLCDERPEALLFHRRILSLHSLLTDAHASHDQDLWKLSPAKRQALDEVLGAANPTPADSLVDQRIHHSGRRAWLAIAACFMVTLIIGSLLVVKRSGPLDLARKTMASSAADAPATPSSPQATAKRVPTSGPLQTEVPATTLYERKAKAMILTTQLPPELIEGTPRPIVLHGMPAEPAPSPPAARGMSFALAKDMSGSLDRLERQSGTDSSSNDKAERKLESARSDKPASGARRLEPAVVAQTPRQQRARIILQTDQKILQPLKMKLAAESDAPLADPPKPVELIEEVAAEQDPYSTFSLNISDASFLVAQAALAKGERPDPTSIKVEQFYNAVDYGDPAPSTGQPVAVAIEQAAHPVIPGRNLVRIAIKTAAEGRAVSQPLRLTLLVDQSGSMVREDRRAAMDQALADLAGLLTANDRISVIGFSRTPRLLADDWTGDKAPQLSELVNQGANEGGTNLEDALKLGEQLAERRKVAGAQNRIVLFTDGAANLGDADPTRLAEKIKALRHNGIAFDIAGIAADGLNDELLGELARNGDGRYYVVGKGADENFARQLAGAFRPAAKNVKVQVHFNPQRVSRYKLIGFENDRLQTQDFRNDAVDAAELAAAEAGVAIYQVETIPRGTGELGDVSVRFRDAASDQMVERTWTIPHDASAPSIDRASPSMQLAVLAMCAAEKLRGGPLADALDFKQFGAARANVKRFYGTTRRVAEVLDMLNSL
ncbi:MAG: hypothetical protein RLZZ282_970 [Verrucomicrobiota bacterium]